MNISKTLKIIVWSLLLLLVILFLIVKVIEFDVWLHLSSGKYICENFKFPGLDPFSYTASHREYVDSHWLYQVIFYVFYSIAGFWGLFLYQLLIIGGIFYVLFRLGKKSNFYITTACILLTLIISNQRFVYRPEMFSYLFAVLFVLILHNYSFACCHSEADLSAEESQNRDASLSLSMTKNGLFVLPVLQILWVNTHGFFIFGPIIILCYILGEVVQVRFFTSFRMTPVYNVILKPIYRLKNLNIEIPIHQGRRHLNAVYLIALLCVVACFINPYGYKLATYPFLLMTEIGSKASPYMKSVTELTPVLFTEKGNYRTFAYFILIVISFASFFVTKKFSFSRFLVYILFLYISWITERNTVFFAFVGSLITILNFYETKDIKILVGSQQLIADYIYSVLMIIVSVFISVGIITNRYFRYEKTMQQFGIGSVDILFPTGAVEYIKKNNVQGNIFNDALIGGYFIWNCWPERKVFIDGKMEIYGEEFLAEYKNVIDNPEAYWKKVSEKYKIDYVLLHPLSPHSKNLIKYLYKNSGWELVFFDESGLVFVKEDSRQFDARGRSAVAEIADYLFKKPQLDGYSKLDKTLALLSYANFYFSTEQYQKARTLYMEVLKYDPDFVEAYINLGAIFVAEKKYDKAMGCYRAAIRRTKKYAEPYYGIAIINVEKGKYEAALEILYVALRKKPVFPEAQFLLCYVYLNLGQFDSAITECKRILACTPSDEQTYNLLGTAYYHKKEYNQAIEYYKKALEINPDFQEAKHNYEACIDITGKK